MDIHKMLKWSGMPQVLIQGAIDQKVPEQFKAKYAKLTAMLVEDQNVKIILAYGNDSPFKDQFCASLMEWYMVKFNKTGQWVLGASGGTHFDDAVGKSGITVVPAAYLLNPLAAKHLMAIVRDNVAVGRAFILGSLSQEEISKTFGPDFMAYLPHLSVAVDLSVEIPKITVI
jgi:hypothetical protein